MLFLKQNKKYIYIYIHVYQNFFCKYKYIVILNKSEFNFTSWRVKANREKKFFIV